MLYEQRQQRRAESAKDAFDMALLTRRQWRSILRAINDADSAHLAEAAATLRAAAPRDWRSKAAKETHVEVTDVNQATAWLDDTDAQLSDIATQVHELRHRIAPRSDTRTETPDDADARIGRRHLGLIAMQDQGTSLASRLQKYVDRLLLAPAPLFVMATRAVRPEHYRFGYPCENSDITQPAAIRTLHGKPTHETIMSVHEIRPTSMTPTTRSRRSSSTRTARSSATAGIIARRSSPRRQAHSPMPRGRSTPTPRPPSGPPCCKHGRGRSTRQDTCSPKRPSATPGWHVSPPASPRPAASPMPKSPS